MQGIHPDVPAQRDGVAYMVPAGVLPCLTLAEHLYVACSMAALLPS